MVKFQTIGALLAALVGTSVLAQNAALPAPTTATPTQSANTLPHWVGPLKGKPIDTACYRKTYLTSTKKCGAGYNFDKIATCWTQCPLEYPVECGMECLPQNKDCTKEIVTKVTSVVNVALNAATSGVFGQLTKAAKGVQQGVLCGQQLYSVTVKIFGYINEVENGGQVDTTKEQLFFLLNKTDFVIYDLPVAVTTCLGLPQISGLSQAKQVVDVVKNFVESVIEKKASGANLLDFKSFLDFANSFQSAVTTKSTGTIAPSLSNATLSVSSLSEADQAFLRDLVSSGVTCGTELKSVINKIIAAVQELKTNQPTSAVDVINFAILNSNLVLKELPDATVGCWNSTAPDGFKNRDQILKTLHVIVSKIVDASSQNGNPVSIDKYAISIANLGLDAISLFDPTGLANMAKEFVEPICGPTIYVGDIDDGPADQALGLETVEKAFRNSTGTWKKTGDGQLKITFTSVDTEDVRVNVLSGGQKVYEVPVKKGTTVVWTKPLSEFQGKTLYLDRWRAGFFGIPGTGGGSLLAWVPNDNDGSLTVDAKINPTSFSDHKLRQ